MSNLKDYQVESQCMHFVQAALIPGVKNEAEAREKYKKWVYQHHCNYPKSPAHIKKECCRTCKLKMTVTEVNTKE